MKNRVVIALMFCALPLAAQNSSLSGLITDAHGAIVQGAVIKATNADTAATRAGISSERGQYELVQVPPGKYSVTVEKPGFRVNSTEVVLQTNTPSTLDVKLEVGAVTETISVNAEAAVINTENASVGNPFTEKQIKEIPLQTRNIVALLGVQPGVAPTGEVLGARRDQNNVMLDGVDVNDNAGKDGFNSVIPIPLDSVQEFRTTIAGLGADQGRSSGGQVSVITKSGSNQFHGTAYEYNRNTDLAANSWFNNRAGVNRAALIRNQYGFSVGGPIIKNKLFFFYNWEARKDRSATSVSRTVPSDTLKQGLVKVALKDGRTVTLNASDIAAIDPLHVGENSYVSSYLNQYPSGNNPLTSADKGLNFNTLTFNAPQHLDNHAQVGKLDYNLGKHALSLRGTLNGASVDGDGGTSGTNLAQFPGQAAASKTLDNSRGLSARDTTIISPTLVNVFGYGYTRLGTASTGSSTVLPSLYFSSPLPTARASHRVAPTTNVTDDMTWTKGRHTIQFGLNFRFAENDNSKFNNLPSYSFSRNTLLGLGGDITADVLAYLAPTYGSGIALASGTNVTNAFGAVLGVLNSYGATYNYNAKGTAIPFGNPVTTAFENHEYEGYIQDAFKWKRNINVTIGLRYSLSGVPYELTGLEVVPQTSLNQFFADRINAANNGIPNSALPTSLVTYGLGGPVNGAKGYYPLDKKDWAPRLAVAYSPDNGTLLERVMGKGSVFRMGAGIVYDHYGSAMAQSFASSGSPGLATTVSQPVNTNFTTGFRYTGNGFPTLPTAAGGSFPLTPAVIKGGFTTFSGVSTDLKAPYEYLLNANYARPLTHNVTIEVGYAGRLGHRQILSQDFGQPLTNFKDPASGQTFRQAGTVLSQLATKGLTDAQVKANPSLVPTQAFFENQTAKLKNLYIPGSATANFFYDVYNIYAGSWLDALNDVDRVRQSDGTCIVKTGCNTFFPLQNSGLQAFTNSGKSAYHAATLTLRRAVSNGWGFDFNYTLGHALDNGSASETSGGALLQDAFNANAYRGPSDFDARHTISADAVIDLPVGKGKMLLGNAPGWLNQIVGGWEATTLISFRTGTPLNVVDSGVYNVNYETSSYAVLAPGATLPKSHFQFDSNGIPSLFANPNAINSFASSDPGTVGSRGILRGLPVFNTDLSLSKSFKLPWEQHRLQVRAEAFNVLNAVNFGSPVTGGTTAGLSLANPSTFGEITSYASGFGPRVMQLALRYEF